jgi:glutamate synthase (NADPH/NADH) large chain
MPGEADAIALRALIERHHAATGSAFARQLLNDWENALASFWKVIPRASLAARAEAEAKAAELEPSRGAAD